MTTSPEQSPFARYLATYPEVAKTSPMSTVASPAKPAIESNALALDKFRGLMACGRAVDAAKFARDNGFTVNPAIVSMPHTERHAAIVAKYGDDGRGEYFRRMNLEALREETTAKAMLEELAAPNAGPIAGLTLDEKIEAIGAGKTGKAGLAAYDEMRAIDEDAAEGWIQSQPALKAERVMRSHQEQTAAHAKAEAERDAATRKREALEYTIEHQTGVVASGMHAVSQELMRRYSGNTQASGFREEYAAAQAALTERKREAIAAASSAYDARIAREAAPVAPAPARSSDPWRGAFR